MRSDRLNTILSELNGSSADIEGSAVVSTDGFLIDSLLPAGMDDDKVSAMTAALLSLSNHTAEELARGSLEQVLIKGEYGYILMSYAGPEAIVIVLTKPEARLGLIFLDITRAADEVQKI